MKKNNSKSVRISDEVLFYIMNFEGNGFNQKFENLVLLCMKLESQKRACIAELDKEIQLRLKKLTAVRQLQAQLTRTSYLMNDAEAQLQALLRLMYETPISPDDCISHAASLPDVSGSE